MSQWKDEKKIERILEKSRERRSSLRRFSELIQLTNERFISHDNIGL